MQLSPNLHSIYANIKTKDFAYIWVNVNAFFTILAFWKIGAFLFRMKEWAFLICVIAIGKMPAPHFLFIFMSLLALLHSQPYVVLMLAQINNSVPVKLHLFKLLIRVNLCFLDSFVDILSLKRLTLRANAFFLYY